MQPAPEQPAPEVSAAPEGDQDTIVIPLSMEDDCLRGILLEARQATGSEANQVIAQDDPNLEHLEERSDSNAESDNAEVTETEAGEEAPSSDEDFDSEAFGGAEGPIADVYHLLSDLLVGAPEPDGGGAESVDGGVPAPETGLAVEGGSANEGDESEVGDGEADARASDSEMSVSVCSSSSLSKRRQPEHESAEEQLDCEDEETAPERGLRTRLRRERPRAWAPRHAENYVRAENYLRAEDLSSDSGGEFGADLDLDLVVSEECPRTAEDAEVLAGLLESGQGGGRRTSSAEPGEQEPLLPRLALYLVGHPQAMVLGGSSSSKRRGRFFANADRSHDVMADKVISGCWACGKLDHESQDCTFKRCFLCSEQGHEHSECRRRTEWCANCRTPGHQRHRCPWIEYRKGFVDASRASTGCRCVRCGEVGHIICGGPLGDFQPPPLRSSPPRRGSPSPSPPTSRRRRQRRRRVRRWACPGGGPLRTCWR